jgi:response regulator RpfG family c-di-GMP phosphodiesterase
MIKWDDLDYPNGVKGDQPVRSAHFCHYRCMDALDQTSLPECWDEEKTKSYIKEQSGSHFDPHIVQSFFELLDEMPDSMKEV